MAPAHEQRWKPSLSTREPGERLFYLRSGVVALCLLACAVFLAIALVRLSLPPAWQWTLPARAEWPAASSLLGALAAGLWQKGRGSYREYRLRPGGTLLLTPEEGLLGRTSAHEPWYPTFATEGEGKGAFRRSASSDASPFERREPDSSIATSERDWTRRFQRELVVSLSDVVSAERVEEGLVLDSPRLLARIHIPRSWPGAERLRADIARWAASERPLPFEAHDENRSAIQLTYDLRRLDPDTPPMHHILVSGEVYGYDALETSLVAALSARGVTVVGPARPRWSLVEILSLVGVGATVAAFLSTGDALLRAFATAALAVALPIALTLNAHRCRGMRARLELAILLLPPLAMLHFADGDWLP